MLQSALKQYPVGKAKDFFFSQNSALKTRELEVACVSCI